MGLLFRNFEVFIKKSEVVDVSGDAGTQSGIAYRFVTR
jgi:hypothetical protein